MNSEINRKYYEPAVQEGDEKASEDWFYATGRITSEWTQLTLICTEFIFIGQLRLLTALGAPQLTGVSFQLLKLSYLIIFPLKVK